MSRWDNGARWFAGNSLKFSVGGVFVNGKMTVSLPITKMDADKQPLAVVQTAKMKDCPILTTGKITPLVLQSWSLTCKRYMKHAEKDPTEIVSFVAEAMLEPCLVAWYQAGQARIDTLTLNQYLEELAKLVLEKNWAHRV